MSHQRRRILNRGVLRMSEKIESVPLTWRGRPIGSVRIKGDVMETLVKLVEAGGPPSISFTVNKAMIDDKEVERVVISIDIVPSRKK